MIKQDEFYFSAEHQNLFTIRQASEWASQYLNKVQIGFLLQTGNFKPRKSPNGKSDKYSFIRFFA